jgi:CRISPR-associated protein Cas2
MARPDHLFVFAYDVRRDGDRARLAMFLDRHLDRVQDSVFEGRLTAGEAHAIGAAAARLIGPDDSLRVYCVPEQGRRASRVYGAGVLAEADDLVLL